MVAGPKAPQMPVVPPQNPPQGAAEVGKSPESAPVLAPKGIVVERPVVPKDDLSEAAELFRTIFKGEILP